MKERVETTMEKFKNGYNCAQAILCGFGDLYGLEETTAFKLAEGFGLGMGGLKDECGALTGAFMLLGLDQSDGGLSQGTTKMDTYASVKEAATAFEAACGSRMCGELLKMEREMKTRASEEELADAAGKNLICLKCVQTAAEYLASHLQNA